MTETILLSSEEKPLENWNKEVLTGYVKRYDDDDIKGKVIDIIGDPRKVSITTPRNIEDSLGIGMHWLGIVFKALGRPFVVGVQVLDSTGVKRLFQLDSCCYGTKVTLIFTILPLVMKDGWNCLEVDLQKLLLKYYSTDFVEIIRVKVHGSCRLRRIYSSYASLSEKQIPHDLRLLQ